ncbi:type I-U CRISPR-associated protein Csb2 [Streptomyces sp. NPDC056159]|uniref:type I-G CRISPR-associated protein Csb2 n=1 Tax=Streptomyces sp. NPDC056159 TaxID=3155537 RepID=UPI003418A776
MRRRASSSVPFTVRVDLLEPLYQASGPQPGRAEWPPHPARLFCALVSVADLDDPVEEAALRWLESQPAPLIRVPAQTTEAVTARHAWVPTNAVAREPGHAVLPGRTNGGSQKSWPQRVLRHPEVAFVWEVEPPQSVRTVLEAIAARVPYFGRATGHALLSAQTAPARADDGEQGTDIAEWQPLQPDDPVQAASTLRVPYPGYLQRLRAAFDAQQPAWQQAQSLRYRLRGAEPPAEAGPDQGPYRDLVTFAFSPGIAVDPGYTLAVTAALRAAVMSRLEKAGHDVRAMPQVHGHKDKNDQGRLCAYLGLPFVGHTHADGMLRGVAVALPHDLPTRHRRALLGVLLHFDGGLRKLAVPKMGPPLNLTYVKPSAPALKSVQPHNWTKPSRVWTTALPMVLDHFPKRGGQGLDDSVVKSCRMAGLPIPEHVEVVRQGGLLPGTRDLASHQLRRKAGEPPLPSCHVRLHFARPLDGPVVLGSKKTFGLGLCLPGPTTTETAS